MTARGRAAPLLFASLEANVLEQGYCEEKGGRGESSNPSLSLLDLIKPPPPPQSRSRPASSSPFPLPSLIPPPTPFLPILLCFSPSLHPRTTTYQSQADTEPPLLFLLHSHPRSYISPQHHAAPTFPPYRSHRPFACRARARAAGDSLHPNQRPEAVGAVAGHGSTQAARCPTSPAVPRGIQEGLLVLPLFDQRLGMPCSCCWVVHGCRDRHCARDPCRLVQDWIRVPRPSD